jgi:hypothetical protein
MIHMFLVGLGKPLWNQDVEELTENFGLGVTKNIFCAIIEEDNLLFLINHEDPI